MPVLSKRSETKLSECHEDLQKVWRQVARDEDVEIYLGHRGEKAQNTAYNAGTSKLPWPKSKHNTKPSKALDAYPKPLNWSDIAAFEKLAKRVKAVAAELGVKIVWGGDWKMRDYVHWELE